MSVDVGDLLAALADEERRIDDLIRRSLERQDAETRQLVARVCGEVDALLAAIEGDHDEGDDLRLAAE